MRLALPIVGLTAGAAWLAAGRAGRRRSLGGRAGGGAGMRLALLIAGPMFGAAWLAQRVELGAGGPRLTGPEAAPA